MVERRIKMLKNALMKQSLNLPSLIKFSGINSDSLKNNYLK